MAAERGILGEGRSEQQVGHENAMGMKLWDLEARAERPVTSAQGSWETHSGQGPLRTSPPGGEGPGQRPSQAPRTQPQVGTILTARMVGLRVSE